MVNPSVFSIFINKQEILKCLLLILDRLSIRNRKNNDCVVLDHSFHLRVFEQKINTISPSDSFSFLVQMSGEDDRKRRKRRFGEDDDDKGTSGSGSGSGSGGAAPMKDNSDDKGEEQQQDTSTEPPQKKPTREEDMKARLNSLTASAALAANQSLQTVSTTQLQIMKEKEKTLVEMVIEATRFGMLKDLVNISLEYTGNVEERFDSEGPFWFTYK